MTMKPFILAPAVLAALLFSCNESKGQMPTTSGYASVTEKMLHGNYMSRWLYHAQPAANPRELNYRQPAGAEIDVVQRADQILKSSSARAIVLIDGNHVVWSGLKDPAAEHKTFDSMSIGKSVASLAVGVALCEGKITLEGSLESWVPELAGTDLGKARVVDLLKMSSGTWSGNSDSSVWESPAQTRSLIEAGQISYLDLLKTPKVNTAEKGFWGSARAPGETFAYKSTDPLAIGLVLRSATGMPYAQWLEQKVLQLSGVKFPVLLVQDAFGYGASSAGVKMRLEDWVRWTVWVKELEGQPGCMGDYVRSATRKQINNQSKKFGASFGGYGYFFWIDNIIDRDSYWALGYGGQRIAWNHQNTRMMIVFSTVENYMDDLYRLYRDWAAIK